MTTVTLEEAQARLPGLVAGLAGGEVAITQGERVVARLVAAPPRAPRVPGNCIGLIEIVSEDDDHLEDFKEYM